MTGLQQAIAAGLISGGGLWLVAVQFSPAWPNLAQSLAMLAPTAAARPAAQKGRGWEAVGAWGLAKLPAKIRPIPDKDLRLLRLTPTAFMARKMAYALAGLLLPGLLVTGLILLGAHLPVALPAGLALVTGVIGFLLPNLAIRSQAARARREWVRTLACFVDLVALERSCGSGTTQALEVAAGVGDSPVFHRLRECLDRSAWAGVAAWDGLRDLAEELGLTDLADVADIIRVSGTEGAGIYTTLAPCYTCTKLLAAARIAAVYYEHDYESSDRRRDEHWQSIFRESGIAVWRKVELSPESGAAFAAAFTGITSERRLGKH